MEAGTSDLKQERGNLIFESIVRWIFFGIVLIVITPLCNVWFRIIVGRTVNFVEYIPDILLTTASVCCNLISICTDKSRKIKYCLRWILGIAAGSIAFVSLGLFFSIRFLEAASIPNDLAGELFYIASWIILFCTIFGSIIEGYTAAKK